VAAAVAVLTLSGLRGWELAAFTWWAAGMAILAFTDLAVRRLPFRLTAATTAGTALLLAPAHVPGMQWASAVLCAAAAAGFYAALRVLSRGGAGLGDVAAALPVGLAAGWFGPAAVLVALAAAHTMAIAMMLGVRVLRWRPVRHLPLGPYLAAGALIAIATRT
jgi:leader peptidase (prepilin peptidase)/N-methyltransferase